MRDAALREDRIPIAVLSSEKKNSDPSNIFRTGYNRFSLQRSRSLNSFSMDFESKIDKIHENLCLLVRRRSIGRVCYPDLINGKETQ